MPQKTTIQKWIHATEPDFIFCVKLNQNITQFRALMIKGKTKALLESYFNAAGQLENRLGAILIQLPSRLHLDLERLDQFLKYYIKAYPVRTAI